MPICGHTTPHGICKRCVSHENERCFQHKECAICFNLLGNRARTLPCGHRFHCDCIDKWKQQGKFTCPTCRAPFDVPQYKVKIIIEPHRGGRITRDLPDSTLDIILDRLNMDISALENNITELRFDIENREELDILLEDLNVPIQTDPSTSVTRNAEP